MSHRLLSAIDDENKREYFELETMYGKRTPPAKRHSLDSTGASYLSNQPFDDGTIIPTQRQLRSPPMHPSVVPQLDMLLLRGICR